MFRKILCFIAIFAGTACSEPFGVDRHDLIAPRILGVRLIDGLFDVQVWNGVSVYHQRTPNVEWFGANGEVLCTGVRCSGVDNIVNEVRYTDGDGGVHTAIFELQDSNIELTPTWQSLPDTMSLALSRRLRTEGTAVETGLGTDAMRISMQVGGMGASDTSKMRWMSADGVGTFLELSALETDFFRADILMDRDEVLENTPLDVEHATIFGLHVDGDGHNQWTWMDVWYAERPLLPHANRWLPVSELPSEWVRGDAVAVTLNWNDEQQDWALTDLEVTTERPVLPECADLGDIETFDWSLLELGICTIDDVNGIRVALETE